MFSAHMIFTTLIIVVIIYIANEKSAHPILVLIFPGKKVRTIFDEIRYKKDIM